ncbi:ISAs1 family transposase [Salmonella enterica]|nr:ISAs1 family transposase [Salmonella enterica subsp. enterica serovar Java]EBV8393102.1 ISAs1 family transposase [Salmonella enterica subsp. enterica serovar Virchow]EDV5631382.1 ISAs1 family transposase [Salmonella enterica subsp. enterica]EFU9023139.1 ISAs1 family transposase [Salmonella enterica]EJM3429939.1 ISAs1 family transposase [Salmonella enterica]
MLSKSGQIKDTGLIEARDYRVLSVTVLEKDFDTSGWPGLTTVGVTQSCRQEKGKAPSQEQRYYISSAGLDEKRFAESVRGHWQVESLHWVLDVSMNEDNCQIYRDHGATNWSQLRKMSLNMLRAEPAKTSIPTKRKRAWMKTAYLEKVLNAGLNQSFKHTNK